MKKFDKYKPWVNIFLIVLLLLYVFAYESEQFIFVSLIMRLKNTVFNCNVNHII